MFRPERSREADCACGAVAHLLYSAVTGKITEVNEELGDHPELVNDEAFTQGWMIKIQVASSAELEELMSAKDYEAFVKNA